MARIAEEHTRKEETTEGERIPEITGKGGFPQDFHYISYRLKDPLDLC